MSPIPFRIVSALTESTYDPFSPEVMTDPFEHYRVLRDRHPMHYMEQYDSWAVSRFDDVWEVWSDTSGRFTVTEGTRIGPSDLRRHNGGVVPPPKLDPIELPPFIESPEYDWMRHAVGGPLRPRAVARLEEFIRGQARARLDELLPRGRFNLTADYGGYVSAATMCHLFGLPTRDAATVLEMVNAGTQTHPETGEFMFQEQGRDARSRYDGLVHDAVLRRRHAGADGRYPAIDGLIRFRLHGRELTDPEIVSQLGTVLVGGAETLPKVVAHGLMELARDPAQRAAVLADRENIPVAFEEMLRYCAPAQWFSRTVKEPASVGGQQLRVGQRLILLVASANRDEREFEAPDEFRWNRSIRRQISFGRGSHHCIGVHVARLEGRILIDELLARVPDYEIDFAAAERPRSSFQLGWMNVPIVV